MQIFHNYLFPSQEMLEALKSLSGFFTENNLRTRRNLRGDVERRSLAINEEFVQSFRAVIEVQAALTFIELLSYFSFQA